MGDRRLGIGPFLGIWAALVLLQGLCFYALPLPMAGKAVVAALLQALKIVPTAWRLNDTGRDPSDAPFFALIPLVNLAAFFSRMLEKTPSEKLWTKRRAGWVGRLGAFQAIGRGLALVRDTLPLGLPLVLVYAVGAGLGGQWMLARLEWFQGLGVERQELLLNVLLALAGLLGLYTLLQVPKRKTASRVSWVPSLFFAPVLLTAGAFTLVQSGMGQELGPLVLSMLVIAWNLAFASVAGGALAVGQITLGDYASRRAPLSAGELFGRIRAQTLDVAAAHGARVHAVSIGMQLLIPGIFYALQLAFVDMIAVLDPKQPALARSGRLTWGMRSRLFKVFFVWVVVSMGLSFALGVALAGPDAMAASLFDPRALTAPTFVLTEVVWALTAWVLEMAVLCMYYDRVAREKGQAAPSGLAEAAEAAR